MSRVDFLLKRASKDHADDTWQERRKKYLSVKSKDLVMPTEKDAELEPKFSFETDTLVINICFDCRLANKKLEAPHVDEENQVLQVSLCRICRANFNIQRRSRFFNHELMLHKKKNSEN